MDVTFDADYGTLIVVQTETSDPSAYIGEPKLFALTTDCCP